MVILNGVKSMLDITHQPGDILEIRGFSNSRVTYSVDFGNGAHETFVDTFSSYADMSEGELLSLDNEAGRVYGLIDNFFDAAKGQMVMVYRGVK